MSAKKENAILARITLITSLGDFISFFAVLVFIHQISGSVLLASYSVPIKSLGIAVGGFLLPSTLSFLTPRRAIFLSQILSFFLILALALMALGKSNAGIILAVLFFQTILKQIFEGARETYSHAIGKAPEQRALQAQILHGFFSAQTFGPVISFILLKTLPIQIPLFIDAASFLFAAIFALQLRKELKPKSGTFSILRPLKYLAQSSNLRKIFLIRSIGYWIPVGIFNYLIFSVIEDYYHVDIVYSAWAYSIIGLGSMVATHLLRDERIKSASGLRKLPDSALAATALFLLAVTRIGFIRMPALIFAIAILGGGGFCNGVNAVTTQSLRRKFTTPDQFPEIVGLELVVGRFTDWVVATLAFVSLKQGLISYETGIWLSAASLIALAFIHLDKDLLKG